MSFGLKGQLACAADTRRGGGIGEIRRALERKGSALEGGGGGDSPTPRAPRLAFRASCESPLPFPF